MLINIDQSSTEINLQVPPWLEQELGPWAGSRRGKGRCDPRKVWSRQEGGEMEQELPRAGMQSWEWCREWCVEWRQNKAPSKQAAKIKCTPLTNSPLAQSHKNISLCQQSIKTNSLCCCIYVLQEQKAASKAFNSSSKTATNFWPANGNNSRPEFPHRRKKPQKTKNPTLLF